MAGEIRFLRQIADGSAGLDEAATAVGFDHAGRDFQKRGFAGTVAADQAHPLASRNLKVGRGQERRAAESERDVAELDQGSHSSGNLAGRCIARLSLPATKSVGPL